MLLVYSELKADIKILLNYIADCIETAVSIGIYLSGAVIGKITASAKMPFTCLKWHSGIVKYG